MLELGGAQRKIKDLEEKVSSLTTDVEYLENEAVTLFFIFNDKVLKMSFSLYRA